MYDCGAVIQVTPVADTYAREAMRRLRGGAADRNFVPGFAGILVRLFALDF